MIRALVVKAFIQEQETKISNPCLPQIDDLSFTAIISAGGEPPRHGHTVVHSIAPYFDQRLPNF